MIKTWQRYFVFEYIKTLFFVLLLIFALYSLIDFSSRRATFHSNGMSFSVAEYLWYYICSFSKELTVLLPFSALIAIIKCVADLNRHRELVALLASGISLRTLLQPFMIIGVVLSLLSIANQEFFYPKAMRSIHQMESKKKLKSKKKKEPLAAVKSTHLQDGSTLLYTYFEPDTNALIDAVWIRSIDDIYKIGALSLDPVPPEGMEVDHFQREGKTLNLADYEKTRAFPELVQSKDILIDKLVEQQELSLSALAKLAPPSLQCTSDKECQVVTSFLLRMLLPWVNLLAVIGPLPLLIRHTRSQSLFFVFGISVFSLVFVFFLMEAAAILGKRQALPPVNAILVPFTLIFFPVLTRYFLLR